MAFLCARNRDKFKIRPAESLPIGQINYKLQKKPEENTNCTFIESPALGRRNRWRLQRDQEETDIATGIPSQCNQANLPPLWIFIGSRGAELPSSRGAKRILLSLIGTSMPPSPAARLLLSPGFGVRRRRAPAISATRLVRPISSGISVIGNVRSLLSDRRLIFVVSIIIPLIRVYDRDGKEKSGTL